MYTTFNPPGFKQMISTSLTAHLMRLHETVTKTKYDLYTDRSTTYPKFDPTGVQTHDIMDSTFSHVIETLGLTTESIEDSRPPGMGVYSAVHRNKHWI